MSKKNAPSVLETKSTEHTQSYFPIPIPIPGETTNATPALFTSAFDALIESGIPVSQVVFHRTVLSYGASKAGDPETALYDSHPKKSRQAKLWYTPHGLVIKQTHGTKIIPLANVSDTKVL